MSELHKFLFDGLPVRGILVRLTDSWKEILQRRADNRNTGEYPVAVRQLLGEMTAAAALMQSNIKFNGALVLQIFGHGPLKLGVVEMQPDLSFRSTATTQGPIADDARLSEMINQNNQGRCAITLDPKEKLPGQQPYQGIVSLWDDQGKPLEKLSDVLQHYMLQSEQLDTTLVLAANDEVAAGLLIQRLPVLGQGNLSAKATVADEDQIGKNEDYQRIAILASSLQPEELLQLDANTILRRLFWEERLRLVDSFTAERRPRFACRCSRERVGRMIQSLGKDEAESILAEIGEIEVACEFCGKQYQFDSVDAAQLFINISPGSSSLH
jgi:molecular chaperone Hsp33